MTKFVDEKNKLEMTRLKAIFKIAVFSIAFSSIVIFLIINH